MKKIFALVAVLAVVTVVGCDSKTTVPSTKSTVVSSPTGTASTSVTTK